MYKNKTIGVSIPAYNEEDFIGATLKGMPDFVDKIYVIDDCSRDKTSAVVLNLSKKDKRITLLRNSPNRGNGYSVVRGFKQGLKDKMDILCIVAGDNQYPQEYLIKLVSTVVDNKYDHAKANRFVHLDELKQMPPFRRLGNSIMSLLTKFASGYYSVIDPLNSYSATKSSIINSLDLDKIPPRYEFENGWLLALYLANASVREIPVPAKYAGEKSDLKVLPFLIRSSIVMVHGLFLRINQKYFLNTFHPVALFFYSGVTLLMFGFVFGTYITINSIGPQTASTATVMLSIVPCIVGFQFLLQAIVLDIQNEPKRLSRT